MNALRTLLGLVVLLVVGLVAPEVASAKSVTGAENRVGGFQVHVDGGVGVDTDRSVEHVRGFVDTGYDFTSRSPHAAKGGGKVCFAAGTLVATEDGLKPIEEVEVGDLVWSKDDETGEESWKPVTKVFVTPKRELLELTFEAEDATAQMLRMTAEHPLWSMDDGEWDKAGHLDLGEQVDTLHGPMWLVAATMSPTAETVYNFEVAESHTYFVGDVGVWAHNACFKFFAQARNRSLDLLGKVNPATRRPVIGRFGDLKGKVVGFETRVNGVWKRFRLDFDPKIGPHFNVEIGKGASRQNFHVTFEGTIADVLSHIP